MQTTEACPHCGRAAIKPRCGLCGKTVADWPEDEAAFLLGAGWTPQEGSTGFWWQPAERRQEERIEKAGERVLRDVNGKETGVEPVYMTIHPAPDVAMPQRRAVENELAIRRGGHREGTVSRRKFSDEECEAALIRAQQARDPEKIAAAKAMCKATVEEHYQRCPCGSWPDSTPTEIREGKVLLSAS